MFKLNMQQRSTTAPTIVEHGKKVTEKSKKKKKIRNECRKRKQLKRSPPRATKLNKYQLISGFPRSPPLTTIITVCVVTLAEVQRAISDSDSTKWIKIDSKFEWVSGAILDSALVGHRMHKLHSLVLALGLSIHTKSQMFSFFFWFSLNVFILFYCLSLSPPTSTSPQYLQCLDAFHRVECSIGQRLNVIVVQRQ